MDPSVLTSGAAAATAHNLSVWGLFMEADIIVKLVMLMLLAASFWSWAVIFEKIVGCGGCNGQAADFEETLLVRRLAGRAVRARSARAARSDDRGVRRRRCANGGARRERAARTPGIRASLQQRIERVMT